MAGNEKKKISEKDSGHPRTLENKAEIIIGHKEMRKTKENRGGCQIQERGGNKSIGIKRLGEEESESICLE